MNKDIASYNSSQQENDKAICGLLRQIIDQALPEAESKIWHAHPVWFLEGNPIVGYSRQKAGIRLMFWSGVDFNESALKPGTGKYKDASIFYSSVDEIRKDDLDHWLMKARTIQWDYKNIVKRRGVLEKIKM
jgi:uncharacterized protein YdhG (YjbR/CyaY superfamily)